MPWHRHLWSPFWRNSRLGTIFLNCQRKRIPGISALRLEKFYGDYWSPQIHSQWIRTKSQCKGNQENIS
jgi:hypothetical protein